MWEKRKNDKVNKKVLLRERKRHTARRVASASYAALSNGAGGVPHPVLAGTLQPSRPGQGGTQGTPHPDLSLCTPLPHPDLGWGTPPVQTCDGVPPPPPVEVWADTQSENITFPHPSDAGGKYIEKCTDVSLFSPPISFCITPSFTT